MNRKRIDAWAKELMAKQIISQSTERYHHHKDKLYIFFKQDAIITYPGVNCIIVTFALTWNKRIKIVEHVQLGDMWEDKFGSYNVTTIEDHLWGYGPMDADYIEKIVSPYLKDEKWKRNNKFGL